MRYCRVEHVREGVTHRGRVEATPQRDVGVAQDREAQEERRPDLHEVPRRQRRALDPSRTDERPVRGAEILDEVRAIGRKSDPSMPPADRGIGHAEIHAVGGTDDDGSPGERQNAPRMEAGEHREGDALVADGDGSRKRERDVCGPSGWDIVSSESMCALLLSDSA